MKKLSLSGAPSDIANEVLSRTIAGMVVAWLRRLLQPWRAIPIWSGTVWYSRDDDGVTLYGTRQIVPVVYIRGRAEGAVRIEFPEGIEGLDNGKAVCGLLRCDDHNGIVASVEFYLQFGNTICVRSLNSEHVFSHEFARKLT